MDISWCCIKHCVLYVCSIFNIKHNPPEKYNKQITFKIMFFYFYGTSNCKPKYVSWFWKFGNFALEIVLKGFARTLINTFENRV